MAVIQVPGKPSLGALLGGGIGQGFATGIAQQRGLAEKLALQEQKQAAQMQRGNAIANALLISNGIEPVSNSPLNEPEGVSNYEEIAALSRDDLIKLEGIRGAKESRDIARERIAVTDTRKFREKIREGAESSRRLKSSVKKQTLLLEKGLKTGPLTWDSLMFKIGLRGAASPEAQAFQANLVDYMEGMRQKFGVRLTDTDLGLVLDKIPDISRTKEGNKLLLALFESQADYEILKKKALQNVMKKGITLDLEERYDNELNRMLEEDPELQKGFERALAGLYQEATGKKIPGKEEVVAERRDIIGQEFQTLPKAAEYKGVIMEDDKGNRMISNGKRWRKM